MSDAKKILVHICCVPCAVPSAERLLLDGHEVVFYFSNSNIHPEQDVLQLRLKM